MRSPVRWCRAPRASTRRWRSTAAPGWLLDVLRSEFTLLAFVDEDGRIDGVTNDAMAQADVPLRCLVVARRGSSPSLPRDATIVVDVDGLIAARYDATPGTAYLIRPDQHVCARWRTPTADIVRAALDHALCRTEAVA